MNQVRQELAAKAEAASTPLPEAQRTYSVERLDAGLLCLGDFVNDEAEIVKLLMNGDMSWAVALEKAPMFTSSAQKLLDAGYPLETPASAYWVPGRIEVVGKVPYSALPTLACFLNSGLS